MSDSDKKKQVIIRPMTQEDYDVVVTMDRNVNTGDRCITFILPLTLGRLVQETAFGFVAEENGKTVGFITGIIQKDPDGNDAAWIYNTGVHQDYRHQRIGTRLAEAFSEGCRQQGIKSVRINVNWGDASLLTWLGVLGFGMSLGKTVTFEKTL